ncbi:MAG: hypothetical protein K2Y23_11450 [Cyanobacteria bacterium]|nr:hypothetical protein [Cyanobacteriota bacterium]
MKTSLIKNQTGIALVTSVMVLALVSALMAGMFAVLLASQRSHAADRDQSVAYAAAHAGLEKLTAGLAALFAVDFSPSAAQISVVDDTPPTITGFTYAAPGGAAGTGYAISFTPDPGPGPNTGNPLASADADITTGPFEGFKGLITPYTLTVTARSTSGNSEVRLRRELQTVAVPVFQFGIFGEKSLGFHAGPNFDFGGRVHTNQSLYIANGTGNTLTFRDKITAFTQVVRNTLSNGVAITLTGHTGNVSIPRVIGGAPGDYRNLLSTESSGTTAAPWAGWKNLSEVTYRTNIRTETTGAKQLNLPLTSQGATPIDLIRRPAVNSNENTANPLVYGQRYYAQASVRILLSDRAADLTGLPQITAGAPLQFDAAGGPAGYVVGAGRPPVAQSPGNEPLIAGGALSSTRVSAIAGGTLTIQTWNGAAWVAGVPTWMKWNQLSTAAIPAIVCNNLTGTQATGCGAHPNIPINTVATFTNTNGTTFTGVVNPASPLNNATINFTAAFTTARNMVATRVFYVGEDPVTCTGVAGNTLTGCTWPAASTLAVNDPVLTGATTAAGTPLLNGFIKIEMQNAANVWSDVTLEWLNYGFAGRPFGSGDLCADPTPNAIIRFQRLRDNGLAAGGCAVAANNYSASLTPTDFQPLTLFDAREGNSRLLPVTDGMNEGGIMGYVALDMDNFRQWVAGTGAYAAGTGNQALNINGYIIYFSDRRGDHNETAGDVETGEYGNEDSINPANAAWAKTNLLEAGEDFNENGTLQTYGETPHALAVPATAVPNMQFDATARPWTVIGSGAATPRLYSARGRLARPVLFRRALKLINGGLNQLPASGITVTSENPVYIQGNWNATGASVVAEPNVPSAIIGDSITLLSNAFNDAMTFQYPNDANSRVASDTGYRFAMVTGKTIPFTKPAAWGVQELGSDGGVHNFMKMLENWGGRNLRYRGSMVSLYYSRQAVGIYRADGNIYSPPTRGYNFDSDFLSPPLLPPGTPMFRDINTLKFRQILRPNQ